MAAEHDEVDRIVDAWGSQRPDLDFSPLEVLSRVDRLSRHLDRARREAFRRSELEPWEWDVLSALRRAGAGTILIDPEALPDLSAGPVLGPDQDEIDEHVTDDAPDADTAKLLAKTVDGVRRDFEHFGFNTAVAKLIELNNAVTRLAAPPRAVVEPLVQMVAPLAPHIAEELWQRLGHEQTVTFEAFPDADPALLVDDTVTCVVQVLGKVRDRLEVAADISDADLEAAALASERVQSAIGDKQVRKVIVRAPKLVNIVAG